MSHSLAVSPLGTLLSELARLGYCREYGRFHRKGQVVVNTEGPRGIEIALRPERGGMQAIATFRPNAPAAAIIATAEALHGC